MKIIAFLAIVSCLLCGTSLFAQWCVPVSLSPAAISALLNESMGSCIGVSGDTLHVVWADRFSTKKGAIYYTRSADTGLTWSTPVAITNMNGNAWNPAIAVNGPNIHVAWREIDTITQHRASHYCHSLDAGNTWGPNIFLDSTADWPAIAVSGHTVYIANDVVTSTSPYNTEIYFLRSLDNGTTWSAPQQLTYAVGRSEDEAIHAEGPYVHMSWNDNRVGQFQILYKESKDYGVTWGPDVVVIPVKDYNTMVWSDSAHVDVVATGAPTGHYQLLLAQSADTGATWSPCINLSNDTAHTYFLPDMVRNGPDLHVVCNSSAGPKYFHSGDGGLSWDIPVTLPGVSFIAYTGCVLHIIYINNTDHHVYYLRNPTGNAGHCDITTGTDNAKKTDRVEIYPNPFTTKAKIVIMASGKIENSALKIFDVLGNEVRNISGNSLNEINIERGNLHAGVYFFRLYQGSHIITTGKLMAE